MLELLLTLLISSPVGAGGQAVLCGGSGPAPCETIGSISGRKMPAAPRPPPSDNQKPSLDIAKCPEPQTAPMLRTTASKCS